MTWEFSLAFWICHGRREENKKNCFSIEHLLATWKMFVSLYPVAFNIRGVAPVWVSFNRLLLDRKMRGKWTQDRGISDMVEQEIRYPAVTVTKEGSALNGPQARCYVMSQSIMWLGILAKYHHPYLGNLEIRHVFVNSLLIRLQWRLSRIIVKTNLID